MTDWKDKIRKELDEERQKKYKPVRSHSSPEIDDETKLRQHRQSFVCHISGCKKVSSGPSSVYSSSSNSSGGESGPISGGFSYTAWDTPTGLSRCEICGLWTCDEHLLPGGEEGYGTSNICQYCWEKFGKKAPKIARKHYLKRMDREYMSNKALKSILDIIDPV